ncbi:MMPL family transporter [Micromonospora sagamiensis]|uniref:RND superfamily putative drug exporter n=1 Tax=Micromonospora sagamiensis TaxID=47875 RepID=A0A562WFZ6_9ACTN|nr:MMPL family transporter [Micromonospora sagamiensis]TWJ28827.1 RND superfamily putative drug exporter [Micromonospora sagamiensis]BCL18145.1 membrane protein [Micromonospora sagamiensis]
MLDALGRLAHRARWWVIAGAVVFLAVAGAWGAKAFDDLAAGGFTYAASESSRAEEVERDRLGRNDADVVVLFGSDRWTVEDPAFRDAARQVLDRLPADRIEGVTDYWRTTAPALVSTDRRETFAAVQIAGATETERLTNYLAVRDHLTSPDLDVTVGGPLALVDDVNTQSKADLTRAEALALPILFLLLVLIFRNVLAALLPVLVGVLAIVGSLAGLRLLAQFTDISIFAVNVVTLLGLGLAVDYSLFMVSRFREEIGAGHPVPQALRRTMVTAGRTIVVSAVTVALALASLAVFPQVFLRSIAVGGVAAVLLAGFFSLTVMAAMLALLGPRLRERRRRAAGTDPDAGTWARIARTVMRRPVLVGGAVVAVLVLLGLPFLRISYGWLDTRVLPVSAESRQVQDALERSFPDSVTRPIDVVVTLDGPTAEPAGRAELAAYLDRVTALPDVRQADVTGLSGDTARVTVQFDGEPISAHGRDVVDAVRAVEPPSGGTVLVGGDAAGFADLMDMLAERLPWMALLVVVTTFVLLFFSFGSLVLPVKAILMNVLSLTAAFGAVVWIFQDGHLDGLLRFTSTGNIDVVQPILIFAVAFGLSMDYEVFLLSRIREHYDLVGDNTEAVAVGLQRSGRIITSAALLLVVVIVSFATSSVLVVKIIGIGLAIAVVVDATIVRALLMPATMRLLGRLNWWVPGPLRPLYNRWGIREGGPVD